MNRVGRLGVILLAVSLAITLEGCTPPIDKEKIIGIWPHPVDNPNVSAGEEYRADGTFRYFFFGTKINIEETGSYKIEGRKLTIKKTSQRNGINGVVKQINDEYTLTIVILNETTLRLTDGKEAIVFTRPKRQ